VRSNYFYDQCDTGFTLDPRQGPEAWNVSKIQYDLLKLLKRERCDLLFTLLPEPESHGHHQAVTLLALEAVAEMPADQRPAVLGVCTASTGSRRTTALYPSGQTPSLTATTTRESLWSFDRRTPILRNSALEYSIVANWVIAEHKSQGKFQMEFGRKIVKHYWLFQISGAQKRSVWTRLIHDMEERHEQHDPVALAASR